MVLHRMPVHVVGLLIAMVALSSAAGAQPPSIVSLSPAMSRNLVELGLGDRLIGVAEHDAAAPAGLPVVGNYLSPNIERLITLHPTHVVMMTGKEGAHSRLVQLAARQQFELVAFATPSSVDEVLAILDDSSGGNLVGGDLAGGDLGDAMGVSDRAAALTAEIRGRLASLQRLTADRPRPRVLLAFGVNPVWVSGPGSVEDDLLRYVGAENAVGESRQAAMMLDREKLMGSRAQVLVLLMPGSPPLGAWDEDVRLDAFRGLGLPAMESGRVTLVADPLVLLVQSAAVDDVAAELAKAIHPDLADAVDALLTESADTDAANDAETHEPAATGPAGCHEPAVELSP